MCCVNVLSMFTFYSYLSVSLSFPLFFRGKSLLYLIFQPFPSPPTIIVTPSHLVPDRPQDAIANWLEEQSETSFKLCYSETKIFNGLHQNIKMVSELLNAFPL